jgi:hypothetical protein
MPRRKPTGGFEEGAAPYESELPDRLDLRLGPGGRVVIPAVFRKAMQVKEGDRLMARGLAQKLVRESIPGTDSLADSLIEDRRREFEQEFGDGSRRT